MLLRHVCFNLTQTSGFVFTFTALVDLASNHCISRTFSVWALNSQISYLSDLVCFFVWWTLKPCSEVVSKSHSVHLIWDSFSILWLSYSEVGNNSGLSSSNMASGRVSTVTISLFLILSSSALILIVRSKITLFLSNISFFLCRLICLDKVSVHQGIFWL